MLYVALYIKIDKLNKTRAKFSSQLNSLCSSYIFAHHNNYFNSFKSNYKFGILSST